MTNNSASQLIAAYLKKHAAEMPQQLDPALLGGQAPDGSAEHEQAESPEHEMAEHQPGGYEAGGEEGGGHEAEIEHLLSQLSPEEIEHLATQLTGDMQHPGEAHEGGDDVAGLAQALQEHLAQNPETELPPEAAPEKAAALNFVKSASYIEGFLGQAIDHGASVKQAVDLYDQALSTTLNELRKSAGIGGDMADSAMRYVKEKGPKVFDAVKSTGRKAYDYAKEKPDKVIGGTVLATGTGYLAKKLLSGKDKDEKEKEKTAAYFEGIIDRAREYGFSDAEAVEIVKSAMAR